MKANEFVKRFGLGLAKQYLNRTKNQGVYIEPKIKLMIHQSVCEPTTSGIDFVFHRDDLKRIVESHELVSDYYGLTRAKEHAGSNYTAPEIKDALKQAIADVESCQ